MILIVSNTDAITLKIDPSVVLATRKYVDDRTIEVKAYADELMAAHLASANPHNQYAPKASPALTGTPTAPTPAKTDNTTKLATTAHVKLVAADYAPLANPALTGKPTAPTAAQTSNDTQLATTAFVKAAITALIDSSPAAMDTLNELAAALGNDPNFATTMTNLLAAKAPLASPALTGTPTAPTAAQTVNNTQLATTAFVKAAVAALLASPAFTGTPTAPTAAQTVNNTQIATTAYVKAALAALVDSSPAALDTLNELAAAMGDDPNFAATMTTELSKKMDKASNGADIPDVAAFLTNLGFGQSVQREGYLIWPGGLIMQWGTLTGNQGNLGAGYPIAFKEQAYQAFTALNDKTDGAVDGISLYVPTANLTNRTSLIALNKGKDLLGVTTASYFVIGK